MTDRAHHRKRWLCLYILCAGVLMIVLDATIVNVALPSIREDLHFGKSLVWVVNAYLVTFGGFLLLGGRLGDLYGQRRLFLLGVALFSLASLACGMATSQPLLIGARAVQGLGGAVVTAVSLSLIASIFSEAGERARAMGVFSFVCASGGSIGVLAGGFLTDLLNWHWVFLVNLPIGAVVFVLCLPLLPAALPGSTAARLDVAGAATVTASSTLAVYAIVNGNDAGWTSGQTIGMLGGAILLLALFLAIEARVRDPLMPLAMFRLRSIATANVISVLWAASMFAWFFISALYMQLVLGYSPLQVGLAYLPANLIMAAFALGLSARLVIRFGLRLPLVVGLLLTALGLALFARVPVNGIFGADLLPAMILFGLGAGIADNPLLLAAMSDVAPSQSGLASGLVNTSFMMGGALGLAALASLAGAHTKGLLVAGTNPAAALTGGYHIAFGCAAALAAASSLVGAAFLRTRRSETGFGGGQAPQERPADLIRD